MSEEIRDVVIVGGGLAGWHSAARLCHAMRGRKLQVRVLRGSAASAPPDPLDVLCASSLSGLPVAHAELGIDEQGFMRECDATFKLATEYRGFGAFGGSYLLPFGEIGARFEAVGFHQFMARVAKSGHDVSLDEFSVPAVAARLGRFAHPTRDARSVLSTYEYGYHFDTQTYTRGLRVLAEKLGAIAVDGDFGGCEIGDSGEIRSVSLDDGTRVAADLVIDCTGTRAAVLGAALEVPFESWRDWLPCDSALVGRIPAPADIAPCTRVSAQPEGWSWRVPLRSAVETAFVHDSRAISPEDAARCASAAAGVDIPALRTLRFENGIRREAWRGNCVAIGAAAGFVEPLASTGLQLIDAAITRLIALFPHRGDMRLTSVEFNRILADQYEQARDFVLLHYLLSERIGGLWSAAATPSPASVARFLELFRHRGRTPILDDEIFEEAWWACACFGLGIRPDRFSIIAEQMNEADLLAQLDKVKRVMRSAVERLPAHRAYLQGYLR